MESAEPLLLPSAPAAPRRAALPLIAAVVPVASGVLLWQITGNAMMLWFTAISPLMLLASFLDLLRNGRRERRRSATEEDDAWERVAQRLSARSDAERRRAAREAPDVLRCLTELPLRSADTGEDVRLAVGRGSVPSPVRLSGGEGDRAHAFRERAATIDDMTVTASLHGGICVRGAGAVSRAVLRALVLQLCLRFAADAIRLTGEGVAELGLDSAPQVRRRSGTLLQVHVGIGTPATDGRDHVALLLLAPGARPPVGVETVIDVDAPEAAIVRSATQEIRCAVEGVSAAQARAVLAAVEGGRRAEGPPAAAGLAEVRSAAGTAERPTREDGPGLRIAIGLAPGTTPVFVDLVRDGPHALVTGITGAGKSELLATWVAAIAASYPPDEVAFVLADFKGGTAFEALRPLPHVAAVLTDLDGAGAERGVQSLRAELRRREAALAERGARSIEEAPGVLPRLVIVVDEFAAFLHEHPELGAVFTDLAARGRALGMHLVLGTQRATGVIREALAANCPLRICLRVSEPQDSRLMLGTEDASSLPGDDEGRGLAFVRRAGDDEPVLFRVARSDRSDVRAIAGEHQGARRAPSPWLPSLPAAVSVAELSPLRNDTDDVTGCREGAGAAGLVLGLVDEPERQRQSVLLLDPVRERGVSVLGGPGTGKSTVVAALRGQSASVLEVPGDLERAWTSVAELAEGRRRFPELLLVDDLDVILSRFPIDYATAWAGLLQRVIRAAPARGTVVVATASRCPGSVSAIADLLPRRVLLRLPNRAEHLAAGGDANGFDPARPPGRGRSGAHEIQLVGVAVHGRRPDDGRGAGRRMRDSASLWRPEARITVVVGPAPERTAKALERTFPDSRVRTLDTLPPTARGVDAEALCDGGRVILVGDPDSWQRRFSLWQDLRERAEVLVLAEAARELRTLAGIRELPPYAEIDAGRAWALRDGALRGRVVVPGLAAHGQ